jgi:hypothetical protein
MLPGIYNVSLTVKDDHNTIDIKVKQITVRPSSYIPRYPIVFADESHVFCSYTLANNIFITNSTDHGENWNIPIKLNNQDYSVVEEYRNADMPDKNHILWTDNRNREDSDIYSIMFNPPTIDLIILEESVHFKNEISFLPVNNWISFTVKNNGISFVESIPVTIEYTCENEISIAYNGYLSYIGAFGVEETYEKPLFYLQMPDFLKALIDFAGIDNITITVDPSDPLEDVNPNDNSITKAVEYGDIFPNLENRENFFIYLKDLLNR